MLVLPPLFPLLWLCFILILSLSLSLLLLRVCFSLAVSAVVKAVDMVSRLPALFRLLGSDDDIVEATGREVFGSDGLHLRDGNM